MYQASSAANIIPILYNYGTGYGKANEVMIMTRIIKTAINNYFGATPKNPSAVLVAGISLMY